MLLSKLSKSLVSFQLHLQITELQAASGSAETRCSDAETGLREIQVQPDLVRGKTLPLKPLGTQQHLCGGHPASCQYIAVPLYDWTW